VLGAVDEKDVELTGLCEALASVARIQDRVGAIAAGFARVGHADRVFAEELTAHGQGAFPVLPQVAALTNGNGSTAVTVGPRAAQWQGELDNVARRHDLEPGLLRAVVMAESGGNPRARSPVGALGLMQLMPDTARSLGVKNPLERAENLEGGARYLSGLVERFGLKQGIAAYNAGPGAVERYGGVPPYPETQAYVKRVLTLYEQGRDGGPEE